MQIREILAERNPGGVRIPLTVRGGPRQTLKSQADYARTSFTKIFKSINHPKAEEFLNAFVKLHMKRIKQRAKIYTPGSGLDRKRAAHLFTVLRDNHLNQIQNFRLARKGLASVNTALGQNIYRVYGAYFLPLMNTAFTAIVVWDLIQRHKQDPKAMNIALIAWYIALVPIEVLSPAIAMINLTGEAVVIAKDLVKEVVSDYQDIEIIAPLETQFSNEINKASAEGLLAMKKELDITDRAAENLHYNPDLDNAKQEIVRMYPKLPEEYVEPLANDLLDVVDSDIDGLLKSTATARKALQL